MCGVARVARREREDWAFEVALLLRNRFLAHEFYDEHYAHEMTRKQWNALVMDSNMMALFRRTMFKRIILVHGAELLILLALAVIPMAVSNPFVLGLLTWAVLAFARRACRACHRLLRCDSRSAPTPEIATVRFAPELGRTGTR